LSHLAETLHALQRHIPSMVAGAPERPAPRYENLPGGGRRLIIDRALLTIAVEKHNWTDKKISHIFGWSTATIFRRRKAWGLAKRNWDDFTPAQLAEVSRVSAPVRLWLIPGYCPSSHHPRRQRRPRLPIYHGQATSPKDQSPSRMGSHRSSAYSTAV
jgi:hypothetical protein